MKLFYLNRKGREKKGEKLKIVGNINEQYFILVCVSNYLMDKVVC